MREAVCTFKYSLASQTHTHGMGLARVTTSNTANSLLGLQLCIEIVFLV